MTASPGMFSALDPRSAVPQPIGDLSAEVLERFRVLVVAGVMVGVLVAGVGSRRRDTSAAVDIA